MKTQNLTKPLAKAPVLTKAFFRACNVLGMDRQDIAPFLGVSEPTLSRLFTKGGVLAPDTKEGELALMLLRIFRSLDSLFGGNEKTMRTWFTAPNTYLMGAPSQLIQDIQGVVRVADYLDAMRGKI